MNNVLGVEDVESEIVAPSIARANGGGIEDDNNPKKEPKQRLLRMTAFQVRPPGRV